MSGRAHVDHREAARDRVSISVSRVVQRWRDESGQLSAFVAAIGVALVLVAGLVVDGGSILTARQQAVNDAFEAARAGAQSLDLSALRSSGAVTLDPTTATTAAETYLASIGATGSVTVSGDVVSVTVELHKPVAILSAVGVGPVTVVGNATATAIEGGPGQ